MMYRIVGDEILWDKLCADCMYDIGSHQQVYGDVPVSEEYPMGTKIIGFRNCTIESKKNANEYGFCKCPEFKSISDDGGKT